MGAFQIQPAYELLPRVIAQWMESSPASGRLRRSRWPANRVNNSRFTADPLGGALNALRHRLLLRLAASPCAEARRAVFPCLEAAGEQPHGLSAPLAPAQSHQRRHQ